MFNIDDVLHVKFDIPEFATECDNYSIERCDAVLFEMENRPEVRHKENRTYYHPVQDYINMPPIEMFKTAELYYSLKSANS